MTSIVDSKSIVLAVLNLIPVVASSDWTEAITERALATAQMEERENDYGEQQNFRLSSTTGEFLISVYIVFKVIKTYFIGLQMNIPLILHYMQLSNLWLYKYKNLNESYKCLQEKKTITKERGKRKSIFIFRSRNIQAASTNNYYPNAKLLQCLN